MKINQLFILPILCLLVACSDKRADFTYLPETPRAGETVRFTNTSTTGEEWLWNFGDNTTSTLKTPSKVYRQPGTYLVTLKVDNKASLVRSKQITVYDTIPNFTCSIADSVGIHIYEDVTFKPLIYNPYSYTLNGEWGIEPNTYTLLSDTAMLTRNPLSVYFEKAGEYTISMHVLLDETDTIISRTINVLDSPKEGVLLRTGSGTDYRQRIFGTRHGLPLETELAACKTLLDQATDSMAIFDNDTFYIADAPVIDGITWEGLIIVNRRLYLRSEENGLYVVNLDASYPVCITEQPVYAIMADVSDNRIYWAERDSVMYLPLIDSPNNKYTKQPIKLNNIKDVIRLAKDNTKR